MPSKITFSTRSDYAKWLRELADGVEKDSNPISLNATMRAKLEKIRMYAEDEFEDARYWGHSLVIHYGFSDDRTLLEQLKDESQN